MSRGSQREFPTWAVLPECCNRRNELLLCNKLFWGSNSFQATTNEAYTTYCIYITSPLRLYFFYGKKKINRKEMKRLLITYFMRVYSYVFLMWKENTLIDNIHQGAYEQYLHEIIDLYSSTPSKFIR